MPETPGFPRRPPRLTLYGTVRPFYFLTFNTHRRRHTLAHENVYRTFVRFAENAFAEHQIAVGRFVIMPDHVHLFVAMPQDGIRLTAWVKALKSVLGKQLLAQGVDNPHWQEGFFDHVLRSSESYSLKWEYVRQNPVRAELVVEADDWPWQGEIVRISY